MIGNDIIDIHETRTSTNWNRVGFTEKIFTSKERSIIADSADPFTAVWRLWSMKESAYKIFIQGGGKPFFNPTKLECNFHSSKKGVVKIDTRIIETSTIINSDYIFSTAVINYADIDTSIFQLNESNSKYQSDFMRQQVLNDFAVSHSLHGGDLKIQKTKAGVPKIHYRNNLLDASLSITHHGKFGAYSILKN